MELIRQIKQTEVEAKKIIEQAGKQAIQQQEDARLERIKMVVEAENERKKIISESNQTAESTSLKESEKLKTAAQSQFQELQEKAGRRTDGAVARVMEYLLSEL